MGAITCAWAPIEGSPHKNIHGGFSAGCWGGELCGAGQVYGGKRRLEKTLANSSEDDLMNDAPHNMRLVRHGKAMLIH